MNYHDYHWKWFPLQSVFGKQKGKHKCYKNTLYSYTASLKVHVANFFPVKWYISFLKWKLNLPEISSGFTVWILYFKQNPPTWTLEAYRSYRTYVGEKGYPLVLFWEVLLVNWTLEPTSPDRTWTGGVPPPSHRWTDRCKNMTFPHSSGAGCNLKWFAITSRKYSLQHCIV